MVSAPATCPHGVPDSATPVLFFSDLQSGPNAGGEGNLGVYVTLYGLRFGAAQGASYVTVGGGEVARYVLWGDSSADIGVTAADRLLARGLERIVVQLGASTKSGDIVVVVNGHASNTIPFTVRQGGIVFVDANAASSGDGSFAAPLKNLYEAKKAKVSAGDTVVLRAGNYSTVDPASASGTQTLLTLSAASAATGGAGAPIAFVGYPDEWPELGAPGASSAYDYAVFFSDAAAISDYTFANLHFTHLIYVAALPLVGARFVGNKADDISATSVDGSAFRNNASLSTSAFLGNYLSSAGFIEAIQGTSVEIAWNEVRDPLYAVSLVGPLVDVSVHDNLLATDNSPILIHGAQRQTSLTNNLLATSIYVQGISAPDGPLLIEHNSLYEGFSFNSGNAAPDPASVLLRNNILHANGGGYLQNLSPGAFSPTHDFYVSSAFAPPFAGEPGAQSGDPLFVSAALEDFRLSEASPARGIGDTSTVCADYLGIIRPTSAAWRGHRRAAIRSGVEVECSSVPIISSGASPSAAWRKFFSRRAKVSRGFQKPWSSNASCRSLPPIRASSPCSSPRQSSLAS